VGVQRVVWSGGLPGGEIWQCGFWLAGGLPGSEAAANAQAALLWSAFANTATGHAWRMTSNTLWGNSTSLNKVTVYVYVAGGRVADFIGIHTDTPMVGIGGTGMPDQVCQVLTLETGLSGRRRRGRMYLPNTKGFLDSGGLVSATDVGTVSAAWKADFTAWNAAGGSAGTLVVVSQTGTSFQPVTAVSMDQRPDIQRRRANRQATGTRVHQTL
jgi:hypothetical protein